MEILKLCGSNTQACQCTCVTVVRKNNQAMDNAKPLVCKDEQREVILWRELGEEVKARASGAVQEFQRKVSPKGDKGEDERSK